MLASRIARPMSARRASSSSASARSGAVREAREELLLAHGADPAGDALPARLVAEEGGDPPERADEVGGLVEDHDDTGAEGRPDRAGPLERQRHVERVRAHEDAGGAAEQDRPDRAAARHAAAELEELAKRRPERDLVDAGPRPRARTGRTASGRWTPPCRSPRSAPRRLGRRRHRG